MNEMDKWVWVRNPDESIANGLLRDKFKVCDPQARRPFQRHSYDDYLAKMSSPYTFIGQLEITAVSAFYGKEVHVHFDQTTLPPSIFATTDDVHLRYTAMSRHYNTF